MEHEWDTEPAPVQLPAPRRLAQSPGPLDIRTLQRAIGNRATGRVVRALAARRLQRYTTVAAPNYAITSGQPEFEAQVVAAPNINAAAPAAPAQVRVSDDGNMAVEDTSLAVRQPKVFYARPTVFNAANTRLAAVHSAYRLFVDRANAISVTLPGQAAKSLDRILPELHATGGHEGLALQVRSDCIMVAREVMRHGNSNRQPRTNRNLPDATFAEFRVARYMVTWVQQQIANNGNLAAFWNWWGSAHTAARTEFANGLPMTQVALDAIATDYANLQVNNAALADQIAQDLGVNQYALPNVGEAFETHRIGTGTPAQTRAGGPAGTIRDFWAQHIGGVVAASGTDRMTLENYARTHEMGTLQDNATHYYFQMYGTGAGQSWHEAWTTGAVAHGLPPVGRPAPADRALTVVVRSG